MKIKIKKLFIFLASFAVVAGCAKSPDLLDVIPQPKPVVLPKPTPTPFISTPTPTPTPIVIHSPTPTPYQYAHVNKNYKLDILNITTKSAKADILWVIDNRSSMSSTQAAVATNAEMFMTKFSQNNGLDWKMSLSSTTMSQEPFIPLTDVGTLKKTTPDLVKKFQTAVKALGTTIASDSDEELTYSPIMKHLAKAPEFLRKDAYLVLIMVTDDREQSPISTVTFLAQIKALKGGSLDKVICFGVFNISTWSGVTSYNSDVLGWDKLFKAVPSKAYDLSSPNYGDLLSNMGEDLVEKIFSFNKTINLDQMPVPTTIVVKYKGVTLKAGLPENGGQWSYDPVYNFIRIEPSVTIDPKVQEFQISYNVAPGYE